MTDAPRYQPPDEAEWWKNRRRQAYALLAALCVIGLATIAGWVPEHAVPLAQTLCWVFASVIAVYSGGCSMVDAFAKVRGAGR